MARYPAAYEAGWQASRRTRTYDLDAAEARWEAKHGPDPRALFAAGWTDYAADAPKGTSVAGLNPVPGPSVACHYCPDRHEAVYDHEGHYGEGPVYAVVCGDLVDYYTTEAVDGLS